MQAEQPLATARPAVYIDVIINGQKQVYEVGVARELHAQLGAVLKSLDTVKPEAKTRAKATRPKKRAAKPKSRNAQK